jgi:hypothetical protein
MVGADTIPKGHVNLEIFRTCIVLADQVECFRHNNPAFVHKLYLHNLSRPRIAQQTHTRMNILGTEQLPRIDTRCANSLLLFVLEHRCIALVTKDLWPQNCVCGTCTLLAAISSTLQPAAQPATDAIPIRGNDGRESPLACILHVENPLAVS